MELRNTRTTILNQGNADEKREEIRQYFHATYSLDEQLYETLASEPAFYLRPEPLRHPLIFGIAHFELVEEGEVVSYPKFASSGEEMVFLEIISGEIGSLVKTACLS